MITQLLLYWAIALVVILELINIYYVIKGSIDDTAYFFIAVGQVVSIFFLAFYYAVQWYRSLQAPDAQGDIFLIVVGIFMLISILILLFLFKRGLYSLIDKYRKAVR